MWARKYAIHVLPLISRIIAAYDQSQLSYACSIPVHIFSNADVKKKQLTGI